MELQTKQINFPANIEELSKFVLVGREKLVAVKAEIRAIEKVELAKEVHLQKIQEASMLSEALLDAEVRLGELFKKIPKGSGGNRKSNDFKKSNGAPFEKTKAEIIKDLGFEKTQAQRFEILADNKDLVEQVKATARENEDLPTRTQVLNLAVERKRKQLRENKYEAIDYENEKRFREALNAIQRIPNEQELPKSLLREWSFVDGMTDTQIEILEKCINRLIEIREQIIWERRCL